MYYNLHLFGQAYNSGTYGSGTYQDANTTTSGGGTTGSGNGGILTNTGFDFALVATIACALIFAALVVHFRKRPAKN